LILGDITEKTDRYSMFKIGPVLCLNHGIGGPSLSIVLNEVLKLLLYAGAKDFTFFRLGTSGGIGIKKIFLNYF
jgi:uridine phosphorylase